MHRTFCSTALVALIAFSARCLAQASPGLPVIRPKVTELGEFRDTTLNAMLIPREASFSPLGTLIAYGTDNALRVWNVRTYSSRVVSTAWCEGIVWSPAGDAIACRKSDEHSSQEQVWMLRLNPVTGESRGSPQRVSVAPTAEFAQQFSPDGNSIAFPRLDSGKHSSLVVVPAAGGTERVLASGYDIGRLRWAVDGRAIFYVSYQDSARTKPMLSRVAVAGGAPQLVHDFTGESHAPALSADNRVVMLSEQQVGAERAVRFGDTTGRALATLTIPADVFAGDKWSGGWDWSGEYRQVAVRESHPRGLRIINIADGKGRDLIGSKAD